MAESVLQIAWSLAALLSSYSALLVCVQHGLHLFLKGLIRQELAVVPWCHSDCATVTAGFRRFVDTESGTFKYFLKVVPTEYADFKGAPSQQRGVALRNTACAGVHPTEVSQ